MTRASSIRTCSHPERRTSFPVRPCRTSRRPRTCLARCRRTACPQGQTPLSRRPPGIVHSPHLRVVLVRRPRRAGFASAMGSRGVTWASLSTSAALEMTTMSHGLQSPLQCDPWIPYITYLLYSFDSCKAISNLTPQEMRRQRSETDSDCLGKYEYEARRRLAIVTGHIGINKAVRYSPVALCAGGHDR
jgi:hypothetical protein